ncbi:MAG: hypothetical protein MUC98_03645 [Desulfobacterota bacterium]|nr:hypothetical protein [Thermodesulfobacteriota bacterium]
MVIVPRGNPVFENLNSYYLDLRRLLEHCQGEMGSGAIYLKSPTAEGAIFFEAHELLGGTFENRSEKLAGKAAVERLLTPLPSENYQVSIYGAEPEEVYYWSSIPNAKRIYEDLSTEFTDLEGLIKKMSSEKLSGYIEISLNSEMDGGFLFFRNGQAVGGYTFWDRNFNASRESQDLLLRKAKRTGGIFHVSKISVEPKEASRKGPAPEVVAALEEFLALLETFYTSSQSAKGDFTTLLKKKFLFLADEYAFLDPFAGEFQYTGKKIRLASEVADAELSKGLLAAAAGLVREQGLSDALKGRVDGWVQKHRKRFLSLGINVDSLLGVR